MYNYANDVINTMIRVFFYDLIVELSQGVWVFFKSAIAIGYKATRRKLTNLG